MADIKYGHGGDIYRNEVQLDFSVNVNPFGMPDSVREALVRSAENCVHYPDMETSKLRGALAAKSGLDEDEILVGNGASALFMAITQAFRPENVLIPAPSFGGYEYAASAAGGRVRYFYCREEEQFVPDDRIFKMLDGVDMLFIGHPANPTGKLLPVAFAKRLIGACEERGIITVLDECFISLCQGGSEASFLKRIGEYQNLIVVRAFTKTYAIPGIRLGYLVCQRKLRERIERQLPEWSVSVPAQEAGVAALGEDGYPEESAAGIAALRGRLEADLREMGCRTFDGDAGFILFRSEVPFYTELLKEKILIRDCGNFEGLCEGYYRVAVRRSEDNERLIGAMRRIAERYSV